MKSLQKKSTSKTALDGFNSDKHLADDFNSFYLWYEKQHFTAHINRFKDKVTAPPAFTPGVAKPVRQTKTKSPGPDNISGQILKHCSDQISGISHYIFTQSLKLQKVPEVWKYSIIAPVSKSNTPKALHDFRPAALTSLVMKSFEKIVKNEFWHKLKNI